MPTAYGLMLRNDYLAHHGIQGQHWGTRNGPPYPLNPAKDYSKEEKKFYKRVAGDKEVTISKGTKFYRMTNGTNSNSWDTKTESEKAKDKDEKLSKLYVNVSPEEFNKYKTMMGTTNILATGKSYVNEFIATQDIKIPSVKTQTKIERKMINDPQIRKELVESLMERGWTREQATNEFKKVNLGATYVGASLAVLGPLALTVVSGASGSSGGVFAGILGLEYGTAGAIVAVAEAHEKRDRQLQLLRGSVGNNNNKLLTERMVSELQKKGYNAMRDTNDRKASVGARSSIVLLDPENQTKLELQRELSRDEFAEAYAIQKYNKLSGYAKKSIDIQDYVKDGQKRYDELKEEYVVNKHNAEAREKALKAAGLKNDEDKKSGNSK